MYKKRKKTHKNNLSSRRYCLNKFTRIKACESVGKLCISTTLQLLLFLIHCKLMVELNYLWALAHFRTIWPCQLDFSVYICYFSKMIGNHGEGVKGWGLTLVYLKILLRLRALGHALHNTHFPEELFLSRKIKIASYPPHSISTMKIQNYLHCRRSHS